VAQDRFRLDPKVCGALAQRVLQKEIEAPPQLRVAFEKGSNFGLTERDDLGATQAVFRRSSSAVPEPAAALLGRRHAGVLVALQLGVHARRPPAAARR